MTVSLFSFNYKSHLIFVMVAGFVEHSFLAFKQNQRHDGIYPEDFS